MFCLEQLPYIKERRLIRCKSDFTGFLAVHIPSGKYPDRHPAECGNVRAGGDELFCATPARCLSMPT
jgi:hypothetical protein